MSQLIEKSKYFKEQADILLKQTGIINDLNEFGHVSLSGSYVGDVMMNGDIDITVVRQEPYLPEEVMEILKKLYLKGKFRSYFIKGDWNDERKGAEFPNGHCIGLKQRLNGERWKVDIWFVDEKEFKNRKESFLDIADFKTTSDQKELILQFKKYRDDNSLEISSQKIYEAVIKKNIKNIKELLK